MAFLYIKAYHGPCNTFHNNVHKPQFLGGLRDSLQKLGFRVDLIPVDFANYCMLEMCGHEIFRCKLQHLHFNTTEKRDIVCMRAIDAAMKSSVMFRRAREYHWFWTYLDHQLLNRGKGTIPDNWVKDVKFKSFEDLEKCIKCCDIHVRNKPKEDQKA